MTEARRLLTEDEQVVLVQAKKPYGSVDERYLRDWLLGTLHSLAESRAREGELVAALNGGDLLDAPCLFCGYNGPGYWQSGTHSEECPWREVGGAEYRDIRALAQGKKVD